jgi:hypothetical protein
MLLWSLLLLAAVKLVSADNSCAQELEMALFKPKVCGIEYFEKLACELNYRIPKLQNFGGAVAAEFCLRFSKANQVGLSLLNAQGLDMCTLANPNAYAMEQIPRELLLRSRADRYQIYEYYYELLNNAFPLPISGPEDPVLDVLGLMYIYLYLFLKCENERIINAVPEIEPVLAYIRSYGIAGPQISMDLSANQVFAAITASVPVNQIYTFSDAVTALLGGDASSYYPIPNGWVGTETIRLLFLILKTDTYSSYTDTIFPIEVRKNNYTKTQNDMMFLTGAAGIARSFAQIVPVNVYNEGACTYSYNLFLAQGNLVRVIFNQTDLLFKKK